MINSFDPSVLTSELLSKLKKEREREVLIKRFSLYGGKKQTLEEIGQPYKITRERVRQIEKSAISKLKTAIKDLDNFNELILSVLTEMGGIATSERLVEKLLKGDKESSKVNSLTFLLHISPEFRSVEEDKFFKEAWALAELTEIPLQKIISEVVSKLEEGGKPLTLQQLKTSISNFPEYSRLSAKNTELLSAVLASSKIVMPTDEGKFGLASWREINPRSIKDKTYYVLKKFGRPMHFSEISTEIAKLHFDIRSVTKQAVHNELIRDGRFVLIGRGIYALAEWGYEPGTVSVVIAQILRKSGRGMHKNEIVKEVLKQRKVKETTIVLNLQNKDLFRRVAKATYTLTSPNE